MAKLADGKMYITRDGRTVGPVRRRGILHSDYQSIQFFDETGRYTRLGWNPDGSFIEGKQSPLDLVRSTRKRVEASNV